MKSDRGEVGTTVEFHYSLTLFSPLPKNIIKLLKPSVQQPLSKHEAEEYF